MSDFTKNIGRGGVDHRSPSLLSTPHVGRSLHTHLAEGIEKYSAIHLVASPGIPLVSSAVLDVSHNPSTVRSSSSSDWRDQKKCRTFLCHRYSCGIDTHIRIPPPRYVRNKNKLSSVRKTKKRLLVLKLFFRGHPLPSTICWPHLPPPIFAVNPVLQGSSLTAVNSRKTPIYFHLLLFNTSN